MAGATISLNSLPKTTAAVAQAFTDPSGVPAGKADVLTYSFRVFAAAQVLVFATFLPRLAAATAVSAVSPPRARASAAAAVFGC